MVMPMKQQAEEGKVTFTCQSCGVSNLYVKIPEYIKVEIVRRMIGEYRKVAALAHYEEISLDDLEHWLDKE